MTNLQIIIRTTMARIQDIEAVFSTILDKTTLAAVFPHTDPLHVWLTTSDLAIFRQAVASGTMKEARFRSPTGYRVLDFLTLLYEMQQQRYSENVRAEKVELQNLCKKNGITKDRIAAVVLTSADWAEAEILTKKQNLATA